MPNFGMRFQVDLDRFLSVAPEKTGSKSCAIARSGNGTIVSAVHPNSGLIVCCWTPQGLEETRSQLESAEFKVEEGLWTDREPEPCDSSDAPEPFVCAIAYRSRETMPGLWVEAFPFQPSQHEALRAMYEEFEATGMTDGVSFEEFIGHANPNVVILSPDELARFARARLEQRPV